jgi:hypothetical protein
MTKARTIEKLEFTILPVVSNFKYFVDRKKHTQLLR